MTTSAFCGNAVSRVFHTGVPGCFPLGNFCSVLSCVFHNVRCFWCLSVLIPHQPLYVISTVPRGGVQRGFGFQISHFTRKPCCASSVQEGESSNLREAAWPHSLLSHLQPPLCWNLLVSQPRQGDGFARHRGKAGNPYTCWSNCKIVETFAASISFQKKRIHRGKWPCCRQITSLST